MSLNIAPRLTRVAHLVIALWLFLVVPTQAAEPAQSVAVSGLKASNATLQLPIPGTHNSAVYLHLQNTGTKPETLVGVSTAAAAKAQLHSHTSVDGMMRMRPVESLTIAPGKTLVFESGSYHIMLLGVEPSIATDDTVELTLELDGGKTAQIMARAVSRYDGADHTHHH